MVGNGYLTLKDMIDGSGCTPRTIRYYERQGLLQAERSRGGHRLFEPSQLMRLAFVLCLREAGWSLDEITTFLSIRDGDGVDRDKAGRLSALVNQQIGRLERKLELLGNLRDDLHAMRELLPVCQVCAEARRQVSCEACQRLPSPGRLPRSFRLSWLSGDLVDDDLPCEDVDGA